jgi:hypothetical protein
VSVATHERHIHLDGFVAIVAKRDKVDILRLPNPLSLLVFQVMYLEFAGRISATFASELVPLHDAQSNALPSGVGIVFSRHLASK